LPVTGFTEAARTAIKSFIDPRLYVTAHTSP
jgi:hypothetical protein